MSDEKNVTFQDTVEWATTESAQRGTRSKGIPVFYLVIGAIIILTLVILIIYLVGRNPDEEIDALGMMKDDKYLFDGEDSYDGSFSEDGDSGIYDEDEYDEGSGVYGGDPEV